MIKVCRIKKQPKFNLKVGGMEVSGNTQKEIHENLVQYVSNVLDGSYIPQLIHIKGMTALLWREPLDGWISKVFENSTTSTAHGANFQRALHAVKVQLCQNTYKPGDGVPHEVKNDTEVVSEVTSWIRFQEIYAEAKRLGFSTNDCHYIAGGMAHIINMEPLEDDQINFLKKY